MTDFKIGDFKIGDFKIGDKVFIKTQPANQCVNLVGETGYIQGFRDGGLVEIETFKDVPEEDCPKLTGSGSVPAKCLVAILPIGSVNKPGDMVEIDNQVVKMLYKFPILQGRGSAGWVVERGAIRQLIFITYYCGAHFAKKEKLQNKANEYMAALIKTAEALSMLE